MLLYCKQEITLLSYSQHERDFSQSILYMGCKSDQFCNSFRKSWPRRLMVGQTQHHCGGESSSTAFLAISELTNRGLTPGLGIRSHHSLLKEQRERIALIALFKKSDKRELPFSLIQTQERFAFYERAIGSFQE